MDVSVIIPVYNRFELLNRAIQSIKDQEGKLKIEIIVVDDASTSDIFSHFDSSSDPIVTIFRNPEKMNAAYSRNFGAARSSGKYIAFLDSDDYWNRDHLVFALQCLNSSQSGLYVAKGRNSGSAENELKASKPFEIIRDGYDFLFNGKGDYRTSGFVCERALFNSVGGFDPLLEKHQDWDFALRSSKIIDICYGLTPTINLDTKAVGRMSFKMNLPASNYFLSKHVSLMNKRMVNNFVINLYKAASLSGNTKVEADARSFVGPHLKSSELSFRGMLIWYFPPLFRVLHKIIR